MEIGTNRKPMDFLLDFHRNYRLLCVKKCKDGNQRVSGS